MNSRWRFTEITVSVIATCKVLLELQVIVPHPGTYINQLRLTDLGVRFLRTAPDHQLAPGFLDRLAARLPDFPKGALALLRDAAACFDVALYRPALVVLGVAAETLIEDGLDELAKRGFPEAGPALKKQAGDRIGSFRKLLQNSSSARKP